MRWLARSQANSLMGSVVRTEASGVTGPTPLMRKIWRPVVPATARRLPAGEILRSLTLPMATGGMVAAVLVVVRLPLASAVKMPICWGAVEHPGGLAGQSARATWLDGSVASMVGR